jgi:DNA-binding CsgD family transcriptional regulator
MQPTTSPSAKGNGAAAHNFAGGMKERAKRREKIAELLKAGIGYKEIAKRLKLSPGTVGYYKAQIEGKPWGKKPEAIRSGVPAHVYALARALRKTVRTHVMACGGDVDDLALQATVLTKALLGE